jgi:hypothetical protein
MFRWCCGESTKRRTWWRWRERQSLCTARMAGIALRSLLAAQSFCWTAIPAQSMDSRCALKTHRPVYEKAELTLLHLRCTLLHTLPQTLVQKQWCSFGYKFADRCGHGRSQHLAADQVGGIWAVLQRAIQNPHALPALPPPPPSALQTGIACVPSLDRLRVANDEAVPVCL